ncbi:MAG TPA: type II toxin-antitoxin system HicB family antitoxin [Xanthobacteraceae bacterium]|nr:type II toxin-antitoxin system HicB family antitoxin [Xanthobacteraceae bacterium]
MAHVDGRRELLQNHMIVPGEGDGRGRRIGARKARRLWHFLPGCIAGGGTVDETLRRGRDALDVHVEGMLAVGEPLPKVRDIAEIRADPACVEDFVDALATNVDLEVFER